MTGARRVRPDQIHARPAHARTLLLIREQRHWSQLDLANELGVARNTVSRWERGEQDPHPAWVRLFKTFLVMPTAVATQPQD